MSRFTRHRAGAAGAAAVLVAVAAASAYTAATAASASAGDPPDPVVARAAAAAPSMLFVQNARAGTFEPIARRRGLARLTLRDVDPHTVYFSDRPRRLTGTTATATVLDGLFGPGRGAPPNAVIELSGGDADADTIAVELTRPRYDVKRATLSYVVRGLKDTALDGRRLATARERLDDRLPRRFGAVSLFVDDADWGNTCTVNVTNAAQSGIHISSTSKWGTDHWDGGDPNGKQWLPGKTQGWKTGGGFSRGCSNSATITTWDGATINVSTTDPYSGSNSYTCDVTQAPGNGYGRYSCTLGPGSTTKGPVILINWTVTQEVAP
ncbi:hypothetical protein [Conexibacter sp. CPCC 206217]|uniref:hypothetical protein n=1 Tax=Conexibacter sp. CPCC 206217 TaxID=3064574 RepID=UPI00271A44B8|nr:hypothetical protein [Conexibacter sp. CPCC 206217]MDO8209749.1 hypothetical protein [Conexibacter sp. CPCC 206217]